MQETQETQEIKEIQEIKAKMMKYAETGEVVRDMAVLNKLSEWGIVIFPFTYRKT
jgi:predicted transcriptional regulator